MNNVKAILENELTKKELQIYQTYNPGLNYPIQKYYENETKIVIENIKQYYLLIQNM